MKIYPVVILAILFFSGCATVLPEQRLNHQGNVALDLNNYSAAIKNYNEAFGVAERTGNQQYAAIAAYGLGRAYGYSCNFEEAEKWLKKSIFLRKSIPDSEIAYLSQNYLELARLYVSWDRWPEAVSKFQSAMPLLKGLNIEARDPIGYANVLEDFKISLSQIGDKDKAKQIKEKINSLRIGHSNRTAAFKPKPYPRKCT